MEGAVGVPDHHRSGTSNEQHPLSDGLALHSVTRFSLMSFDLFPHLVSCGWRYPLGLPKYWWLLLVIQCIHSLVMGQLLRARGAAHGRMPP